MGTGLDLHARRADGTEIPVEISLSPVAEGNRVVAIVRDVTERRVVEAELREAHDALALGDDRERIARNLHDTVVQRMFAIGLSLQSALMRMGDDPIAERIENAVDEIDATIRDIRAAIFSLHTQRTFSGSLRDDILTLSREAARALGYEPRVSFDGPIDTMVNDELRGELVAIVREALSNIARHAQATEASVEVMVDDGLLTVRVVDNGVGIAANARPGEGLANLRDRAAASGGTIEIGAAATGQGTQVELLIRVEGHAPARD
jgi:signal transduction histidine kinase